MSVQPCKCGGFEYGGLSVNCCVSVIMVSHNISHLPRRVDHAEQASESRRQLVLAVALGARSAWSMASGGDCVAGRARVDHGYVRARVVGKRKPSVAAAWRYGRCLERAARHHRGARHDEPGPSKALAERKAQAQVGDDDMVAFLHLHGSRPVGGEHGTEVE